MLKKMMILAICGVLLAACVRHGDMKKDGMMDSSMGKQEMMKGHGGMQDQGMMEKSGSM